MGPRKNRTKLACEQLRVIKLTVLPQKTLMFFFVRHSLYILSIKYDLPRALYI